MAQGLYALYCWIKEHRLATLLLGLGFLCGLFALIKPITFEEDITQLIPKNNQNEELQQVLQTVGFTDKIIVNIRKEDQGNVDDLTQYAQHFLDSLAQNGSNYVKHIQGAMGESNIQGTLDFVWENLPLLLDEADYIKLEEKINPDSIAAITHANYRTLVAPIGLIAKKNILKDPLGLSSLGLQKLKQLNFGDGFVLHNGFLMGKDLQNVVLFINPITATDNTADNTRFAHILYKINDQLNQQFKGRVKAEYFGGPLIAVANAQQIKKDIWFTVGIAMSLLLILLGWFYRKAVVPLILFIPTLFGGLLALALLVCIRDQISAISLGIGSILLGITLDYSLHILTHIRTNNTVKGLYKEVTKPILMSSLTTAIAFMCLLFLRSQALQDLGIFAAMSVLGASVFALIIIPQAYRPGNSQKRRSTFIDRWAKYPIHKKKIIPILLGVLLVASLFSYNQVGFNRDLAQFNYQPKALQDAQLRLDKLTNISSRSVYIIAYGNSLENALAANDRIYPKLQEMEANGEIMGYSSLGGLLKSKQVQERKLTDWNHFWNTATRDSVLTRLDDAGASLGFKPNTYAPFKSYLGKTFSAMDTASLKALDFLALDDYLNTREAYVTLTNLAQVTPDMVTKVRESFKDWPQVVTIDRQQMKESFLGTLKDDFNRLIQFSLLAILLLLLIFYRSFSLTLVTVLPIVLTWILTIGIMGFLGMEFNIFNVIISTFIFGLGVDYSIFITNGLLHQYRTGERVLPTYKTSIILSLITTILGVGVLIFAKHPALNSIALVSILGIVSAVTICFSLQPLFFQLFIGSESKRPTSPRVVIHSFFSLIYYALGCVLSPIFGVLLIKLLPFPKVKKMAWFHKMNSKFLTSVLYTNPFVAKRIENKVGENFDKPAMLIANHTSSLDSLAISMLHSKIAFLVNDWVYRSPIFGKAVKLAGFFPVSSGIDKALGPLSQKVADGYSPMAFPEGTRSQTNAIKRFHKGAFYLAEELQLDILPVLIHGNSEVMPKGDFAIRDGSITLRYLKRIKKEDLSFGSTSRERTRSIGAHMRAEFLKMRRELEGPTYFHPVLLDCFRFRGSEQYLQVKQQLKQFALTYHSLMDSLSQKERIANLSDGLGVLELLLLLDGANRKLYVHTDNKEVAHLLTHNFITAQRPRLEIRSTASPVDPELVDTLLIEGNGISQKTRALFLDKGYKKVIFLKGNKVEKGWETPPGYAVSQEDESLLILTKLDV